MGHMRGETLTQKDHKAWKEARDQPETEEAWEKAERLARQYVAQTRCTPPKWLRNTTGFKATTGLNEDLGEDHAVFATTCELFTLGVEGHS